jgi:hypothetical protein
MKAQTDSMDGPDIQAAGGVGGGPGGSSCGFTPSCWAAATEGCIKEVESTFELGDDGKEKDLECIHITG